MNNPLYQAINIITSPLKIKLGSGTHRYCSRLLSSQSRLLFFGENLPELIGLWNPLWTTPYTKQSTSFRSYQKIKSGLGTHSHCPGHLLGHSRLNFCGHDIYELLKLQAQHYSRQSMADPRVLCPTRDLCFFVQKLQRLSNCKQPLILSNQHDSDPINKLSRAWEPIGTVPDSCQVSPDYCFLVKTFRK
jgi:hypothetical protein